MIKITQGYQNWVMFFSNELKLLVLPSPLGREGERLLCAISAKDINKISLSQPPQKGRS